MSGTPAGGRKAMQTNKTRYGKKFPETIGRKGGLNSRGGGFSRNHDLAVEAGQKGGKGNAKSEYCPTCDDYVTKAHARRHGEESK